jgi:hypothetical protein
MSPIAARNVAAQMTFTPGTVNRYLASGESSACRATTRSTSAISASRNSMWRMHASIVSHSSTGNSSPRSHSRPALPNRSENGQRPTSRRISTACTSFFELATASWPGVKATLQNRRKDYLYSNG